MIVYNWPPGLSLLEIDTKMSVFWVQIHGLPLEYMTNENVAKIGAKSDQIKIEVSNYRLLLWLSRASSTSLSFPSNQIRSLRLWAMDES